jgi:predicted nuclease of predicted toxin-antitoxin system
LDRVADAEIMARAMRDARTVVTANLDYPRLLALAGVAGPSLILFRGGNWNETDVVARMQQVLGSLGASELTGNIIVVDRHRLRRRRLPIS